MKLALFVGCRIPGELPQLETASRAVLTALGVELVEVPFGCRAGYPQQLRLDAFLLLAARNLAMAHRAGLDILTLCQCCYGNLRHAQHLLRRDAGLKAAVQGALAADGLELSDGTRVRHFLDLLARDVGVAALAARVVAPQRRLKMAAHYGCHALRPSNVVDLDNPNAPHVFEELIRAAGSEPVDWPRRLECCGASLAESNPTLAARLKIAKLEDEKEAGAGVVCTACPHCQGQFAGEAAAMGLKSVFYPQLLGLALGLSADRLGIEGPL